MRSTSTYTFFAHQRPGLAICGWWAGGVRCDLADRNPGAADGGGAYTVLLCAVKSVTNRRAWMHGALLLFFYPIIYSFTFFKISFNFFIYLFLNVFL
jgi:hypothetical protein